MSENFSFSSESDLIIFALRCWRWWVRWLKAWRSATEPAVRIFLHLSVGFLLASYQNTMNLILERQEILCIIFLVTETSIVWPNGPVWIHLAYASTFDCQTVTLPPTSDASIVCDSTERELRHLRSHLRPVDCNRQIPGEPLVWISEGWNGGIWKNTKVQAEMQWARRTDLQGDRAAVGKGQSCIITVQPELLLDRGEKRIPLPFPRAKQSPNRCPQSA